MTEQPPRDGSREPDPSDPAWVDHILDQLTSRPMPAGPDVEPVAAPGVEPADSPEDALLEDSPPEASEPEPPPPADHQPEPPAAQPQDAPGESRTPAAPETPPGLLGELMLPDPVNPVEEPQPQPAPPVPQPQPAPPPVVEPVPAPAPPVPQPQPAPPPMVEPPVSPRAAPAPPEAPQAPPRSPLPPPIPPPPRRAPHGRPAPPARRGDPLLSAGPPPAPPAAPPAERRRRSRAVPGEPDPALYDDEDAFDEFGEHLEESRAPWRTAAGWVITIALAIVLSLVIRSFVAHAFHVESGSMEPTLLPGDRILVNKLSDNPSRGDLVVFGRSDGDLVKRVVALEGETIIFEDGLVRIGDQWLNEPYLSAGTGTYARTAIPNCDPSEGFGGEAACTVPEGSVFVLGDNRGVSFDSRNFGPVPREDIVGDAAFQFWPLGDLRGL